MVFPEVAEAAAKDFESTVKNEASTIFENDPVLKEAGAEDNGEVTLLQNVDPEDGFSAEEIVEDSKGATAAAQAVSILAGLVTVYVLMG